MDFIGLLPIFSTNVRKSSFFFFTCTLLGSKPVSLIIEGITYRLGSIVEWTINGTLVLFRYVPEAGLSKCPNILKVHYKTKIK